MIKINEQVSSDEVLEGVTVPQSQQYLCYIIISLDCLRVIGPRGYQTYRFGEEDIISDSDKDNCSRGKVFARTNRLTCMFLTPPLDLIAATSP